MSDLIVIEKKSIALVFKAGGSQPLIDKLQMEVDKFKGDVSTVRGRKEIASFAYSIGITCKCG